MVPRPLYKSSERKVRYERSMRIDCFEYVYAIPSKKCVPYSRAANVMQNMGTTCTFVSRATQRSPAPKFAPHRECTIFCTLSVDQLRNGKLVHFPMMCETSSNWQVYIDGSDSPQIPAVTLAKRHLLQQLLVPTNTTIELNCRTKTLHNGN
jgi:hypothetical protein